VLKIHIDRIVLRDLDMAPERAESLRASLASELKKIIIRDGLPEGLAGGKISRLSAPALELPESGRERQMAGILAGSIHRGLKGLGRRR
jgi:hypothetical protein